MNRAVSGPFMADSARGVVGQLRLGNWVVFLHEWADKGEIDPSHWQEVVQAACAEDEIDCEIVVIEPKSLTVIFNKALAPDFDMIRSSIDAVLHKRWVGEPIPSELKYRTGSDDPFALFSYRPPPRDR
jgi:hypothetical protein